jgi:hypothetical protein
MPSGTLPNAGSLGDPQITTGDYQTQINQLLAYVRSLQAEVSALSGTQIKEGAVRGVGNIDGGLYARGEIDAEVVFDNPSGQTLVSYSELSDSSDGWYVVQHGDCWSMIYIGGDYGAIEYSVMSKLILTSSSPFVFTFTTLGIFGDTISSRTQQYDATNASSNSFLNNIFKVLKV